MKVYEALANAFAAAGASRVFNLMGDGNKLWLVAMARRPGVTLVNARHEAAALTMADGFARVTGDVGICSVTYSTGLTQIATPLAVAARHRTPLVVFAAEVPREHRGPDSQIDINERALVRTCGALTCDVETASTAVRDVRTAFHMARSQRLPVVLFADPDLQEQEVPAGAEPTISTTTAATEELAAIRSVPGQQALGEAVALIRRARRPLVLAGRGAVESGAHDALVELAASTGALLATTLAAKGYFDGDDCNLGVAGHYSDARARELLRTVDCLIAVGASLNKYTRGLGQFLTEAPTVRIDVRQDRPLAPGGDTAFLLGDAEATTRALTSELASAEAAAPTWRTADLTRQLAVDPRSAEIERQPVAPPRGTLDPRSLLLALDGTLPDDCEVIVGVGNFTTFPVRYLRNPGKRRFHVLLDFITIGQALPAAVGAALADGAGPVVAFEGDASLMMHLQELETAVRYQAPMLLFVLNDGALGAEYHKLRMHEVDPQQSLMPTPDLGELATAFGARFRRLEQLSEAASIMQWFDPTEGPHIVDCPLTRDVVGEL